MRSGHRGAGSGSVAEHCDTLAHAKIEIGIKTGRLSGPMSVLLPPSHPGVGFSSPPSCPASGQFPLLLHLLSTPRFLSLNLSELPG